VVVVRRLLEPCTSYLVRTVLRGGVDSDIISLPNQLPRAGVWGGFARVALREWELLQPPEDFGSTPLVEAYTYQLPGIIIQCPVAPILPD
jgi:hypothetical protein